MVSKLEKLILAQFVVINIGLGVTILGLSMSYYNSHLIERRVMVEKLEKPQPYVFGGLGVSLTSSLSLLATSQLYRKRRDSNEILEYVQ